MAVRQPLIGTEMSRIESTGRLYARSPFPTTLSQSKTVPTAGPSAPPVTLSYVLTPSLSRRIVEPVKRRVKVA